MRCRCEIGEPYSRHLSDSRDNGRAAMGEDKAKRYEKIDFLGEGQVNIFKLLCLTSLYTLSSIGINFMPGFIETEPQKCVDDVSSLIIAHWSCLVRLSMKRKRGLSASKE